jgi:hypothetical protein
MAASLEVLLILVSSETTARFPPAALVVSTPRRSIKRSRDLLERIAACQADVVALQNVKRNLHPSSRRRAPRLS